MNRRIVFVLLGVALLIACAQYSEISDGQTIRRISLWPETPAFTLLWFVRMFTAFVGVFFIWLGWRQAQKGLVVAARTLPPCSSTLRTGLCDESTNDL